MGADSIGVVGIGHACAAGGRQTRKLSAVLPGEGCTVVVVGRVSYCIIINRMPVVACQLILPVAVTVQIIVGIGCCIIKIILTISKTTLPYKRNNVQLFKW